MEVVSNETGERVTATSVGYTGAEKVNIIKHSVIICSFLKFPSDPTTDWGQKNYCCKGLFTMVVGLPDKAIWLGQERWFFRAFARIPAQDSPG